MKFFYSLVLVLFVMHAGAQTITFGHPLLKTVLMNPNLNNHAVDAEGNYVNLDTNGDGEIQVSEALVAKEIVIITNLGINSIVGLEHFANLEKFEFRNETVYHENMVALAGLTNLTDVIIQHSATSTSADGGIQHIDLSGCTALINLDVQGNDLQSIDLSGCVNLENVNVGGNLITSLDVSGFAALKSLTAQSNMLTTLNVSGCFALQELYCGINSISTLDLAGMSNLHTLYSSMNQLVNLDASGCFMLDNLTLDLNPNLEFLNIKNGHNEVQMSFTNCPNLRYICADETQYSYVASRIINANLSGICAYGSYCTFAPGGTVYYMSGSNTWDTNNNGCGSGDPILPSLRFNITGATTGAYISDGSGSYSIPFIAGAHTVNPVLPYPGYFTITPSQVVVNFPTTTSPQITNFCIQPNGVRPDLEVVILPLEVARPGFDVTYSLRVINRGNTIQSGSVNMTFDDSVLDFVSALPAESSQSYGSLVFNFSNLQPFAVADYSIKFNCNSPTDEPSLNSGDSLPYNATVTSAAVDETPADNAFTFWHSVVNSFDPNDKTCLEGDVVGQDMIGKYVHYLIRFENTGTFPAQNVVVSDSFSFSKFDMSSFMPIAASHPYTTRISGNQVEFIFENINLPFDDGNNDGYVAFKIKTKPTLVVGDTFSNTASIYFDYNFPIVTDPATTTIQLLGNPDFEFPQYFTLFPNPVKNLLNVKTKNGIEMKSASIYNMLGQLIQTVAGSFESIDVSGLVSGNYFLKINSDKGIRTTKFIKK